MEKLALLLSERLFRVDSLRVIDMLYEGMWRELCRSVGGIHSVKDDCVLSGYISVCVRACVGLIMFILVRLTDRGRNRPGFTADLKLN